MATEETASTPPRSLDKMFPLHTLSERERESFERVRAKLVGSPFFEHVPLSGFPLTLPVALDLAIKVLEWTALNGDDLTYWTARFVLPALREAHRRSHG